MQITDIKIRRICHQPRMRALVSVTLEDCFAVHDIKVIQGDDRLFVAMPSRKEENGTFRDIAHPITTQMRQRLEQAVIEAYLQQSTFDGEEDILIV